MTSIDTAIAAHPSYRWARVSLVLIAAIELLDALSSMQGIFTEYHHETALLRFAQGINSIKLALSPLLAGAALVLAARGNLRYAIFALAALTLAGWLLDSLADNCNSRLQTVARFRRHRRVRFLSDHAGYSGRRYSAGGEAATSRPCRGLVASWHVITSTATDQLSAVPLVMKPIFGK